LGGLKEEKGGNSGGPTYRVRSETHRKAITRVSTWETISEKGELQKGPTFGAT